MFPPSLPEESQADRHRADWSCPSSERAPWVAQPPQCMTSSAQRPSLRCLVKERLRLSVSLTRHETAERSPAFPKQCTSCLLPSALPEYPKDTF